MRSCSSRAAAIGAVAVSRASVGRHLDRHVAVDAVALVVDRPQDRERVLDVGGHQRPVGVLDRLPAADQVAELLVVVGGAGEIAFWKIVGLDVMPRTPRSTHRASSPHVIQPRRRLSSQGLWPCS